MQLGVLSWTVGVTHRFFFTQLIFEIEILSLCRHFEIISDLSFSKFFWPAFMLQSFSSKQRLHLFSPLVHVSGVSFQDGPAFHVESKVRFFVFNSHTYLDSLVSLECFLSAKDFVWFLYRSLKLLAVISMYCFFSPVSSLQCLSGWFSPKISPISRESIREWMSIGAYALFSLPAML